MITQHFFKTLITFAVLILLGLLGLFLVSYFGKSKNEAVGGANALQGYEYYQQVAK